MKLSAKDGAPDFSRDELLAAGLDEPDVEQVSRNGDAANGRPKQVQRINACQELLDRKLPSDPSSELMVLRAIALDPTVIDSADITAGHFIEENHRTIFAQIARLREEQRPIDTRHIAEALREEGHLDGIGGVGALADMIAGESLPSQAGHYIAAVRDAYARRQVVFESRLLMQEAYSDKSTAGVLADAKGRLARIETVGFVGARPVITPLNSIVSEKIEWFWHGRYALGKFGLIIGDPGEGKSLLCADIAARTTRGTLWPCSVDRAPTGKVLLICCEDDAGDTIRPRLEAAGADLAKIDLWRGIEYVDEASGEVRERMLNLQSDISMLAARLDGGNYRLVILDTLTGFMGKADNNSSTDVRNALTPLSVLAAKHRVAIIGVQHLNKNNTVSAKYRTNGSIGYNGLARSVLAVARDHKDKGLRLVAGVKGNLAPMPATLGFRVAADDGVPHIEWLAKPVEVNADEMLAAPVHAKAKDRAAEWLKAFLVDGPQAVNDIFDAGEVSDFSQAALRSAGKSLNLGKVKTGFRGGWLWFLPGHGALAEKWPSSTSSGKTADEAHTFVEETRIFEDDDSSPEDAQNSPEDAPE